MAHCSRTKKSPPGQRRTLPGREERCHDWSPLGQRAIPVWRRIREARWRLGNRQSGLLSRCGFLCSGYFFGCSGFFGVLGLFHFLGGAGVLVRCGRGSSGGRGGWGRSYGWGSRSCRSRLAAFFSRNRRGSWNSWSCWRCRSSCGSSRHRGSGRLGCVAAGSRGLGEGSGCEQAGDQGGDGLLHGQAPRREWGKSFGVSCIIAVSLSLKTMPKTR